MTTEESEKIFNRFVFGGEWDSKECVEEAARAIQRRLTADDCRQINDALLAQLATAKEARGNDTPKKALLEDPYVSTLVNSLALVNQAWITTVIAKNIHGRKHLHGLSVDELYSTALTGAGAVGGVMNAILQYDYNTSGVDAFTNYLARAITNALLPTPKEKKTYRGVESRMYPIDQRDEDGAEPGWVDRLAKRPETVSINHELLEVLQDVIPYLPNGQQRLTADLVIAHILTTGEMPPARAIAAAQQPPVSRQRGREIFKDTVNGIRRLIEERYPQLAEQGINGWEEFRKVFDRPSPALAR